MKAWLPIVLSGLLFSVGVKNVPERTDSVDACVARFQLKITRDLGRSRDVALWKPQIRAYSRRHYRQDRWQLKPTVIVLHFTGSIGFPWELIKDKSSAGEPPGLASHYIVDGRTIWEVLPPSVRSRGAYGINHQAINIEQVALDAKALAKKRETLDTTAILTHCLMQTFQIPLGKIYAHSEVARMDKRIVPEVLDLVDPRPYSRDDPGQNNLLYIKKYISQLKGAKLSL